MVNSASAPSGQSAQWASRLVAVRTAPAVRQLSAKLGVETPICEAVAAILAGEVDIDTAIEGLLSRPLRAEGE